jgi:hypothetical protein
VIDESIPPLPWRVGTGYEQCEPGVWIANEKGVIVYGEMGNEEKILTEVDVPLSLEDATRMVDAVNEVDRLRERKRVLTKALRNIVALADGRRHYDGTDGYECFDALGEVKDMAKRALEEKST